MGRRRLPKTKLIRVRVSDVRNLRRMADNSQRKIQLPDLMSEIIRYYKRRK